MRRACRGLAAVALLAVYLAACSGSSVPTTSVMWHEIDLAALAPPTNGIEVDAVTGGPPWLLGGDLLEPGEREPVPAVWSSVDGHTWQARAMLPITPDGAHSRILSVAARNGVLVAIGNHPSPLHGNPRPTVWRALSDGPFREVPTERELFGGPDIITFGRITAGPLGFLMPGSWDTSAGVGAAVWFSPDGLTWTRTTAPPFQPQAGQIVGAAGAASGSSVVVAAGRAIETVGGRAGVDRPVAWVAPDPAGPWTTSPVDTPTSGQPGAVDAVVTEPAGIMAVGWSGGSRSMTVWKSVDAGRAWSVAVLPGDPPAPTAGRDESAIDLASDDQAVVIAVARPPSSEVWVTPWSVRWSIVAVPPAARSATATAVGLSGRTLILLDPVAGRIWSAVLPPFA